MISIIYKILTNNPPEGGNWELWIQLRRNRIHLEWLTGGWLKVKRTPLPHLKTDCCRSTTWYLLCSVLTPAIFLHLYLYLYLYCFLLFNVTLPQVVVEELALADYVLVNRSCDHHVVANKYLFIQKFQNIANKYLFYLKVSKYFQIWGCTIFGLQNIFRFEIHWYMCKSTSKDITQAQTSRSLATVRLVFTRTIGYYFLRTYFPLIIIVFWWGKVQAWNLSVPVLG